MDDSWWNQTFPAGRQTLNLRTSSEQTVAVSYGERGEGLSVILAHGVGSWSYGWRHAIAPLSQQFRTICFDAVGHGFSEKSEPSKKPDRQVSELKQIVEQLCDRAPIIVAQSLGALIALAAALESPNLFSHLVLINAPVFVEKLPAWWMNVLANLPIEMVRGIDRARWVKFVAPTFRSLTQFARQEVVANPASITEEDVYWITYPYVEFPGAIANMAEELQNALREIENLRDNRPNLIRPIQENLGAIACPTLVLWGERDRWFPVHHGAKLHQNLPNSRFQILPNCGHDAAADAPQEIAAAISSFLAHF
ncbi:alpha/beta hydrolase [Lusitaniella coriacea LEGE 07157]|uniref:Alpha/beta hydrolase n=1 Tax=Lusitaniella coriacea LEGE 07157 TaxID=945747 RepID=A0A8J7IUR7_9CYAN|nr:alpha/beta hydrolase [Lusitaniella coriacea]MBE9117857.1 alpha/beta hydrolase [Lusitaniella coriacea LEGE 07157]